eukprot:g6988.t1
MADNGSNGSVDKGLGTEILQKYVANEVSLEERSEANGPLPALKFPEVLPPDGACFGIVLAFLLTAIRNYSQTALLNSPTVKEGKINPFTFIRAMHWSGGGRLVFFPLVLVVVGLVWLAYGVAYSVAFIFRRMFGPMCLVMVS